MDNQQAFEIMVRGLSGRGWTMAAEGANLFGDLVCRYRTGDGTPCAIGLLIPDEAYHPCLEGLPPDLALYKSGVAHHCSRHFLVEAQCAHDSNRTPSQMMESFERLGKKFDLVWPEEASTEEK